MNPNTYREEKNSERGKGGSHMERVSYPRQTLQPSYIRTFNHSLHKHSEILGAAGEAVLIKVHEVHHE
jgi:hypothetical protein